MRQVDYMIVLFQLKEALNCPSRALPSYPTNDVAMEELAGGQNDGLKGADFKAPAHGADANTEPFFTR